MAETASSALNFRLTTGRTQGMRLRSNPASRPKKSASPKAVTSVAELWARGVKPANRAAGSGFGPSVLRTPAEGAWAVPAGGGAGTASGGVPAKTGKGPEGISRANSLVKGVQLVGAHSRPDASTRTVPAVAGIRARNTVGPAYTGVSPSSAPEATSFFRRGGGAVTATARSPSGPARKTPTSVGRPSVDSGP